jgi:lysophospholipase L1-like esterase
MKKLILLSSTLLLIIMTAFIAVGQQKREFRQLTPEQIENMRKARAEQMANDWGGLAYYIFMGDSITQGWSNTDHDFFAGKPWLNRGISGQTTPQMLVRFRADVIKLKPAVVVILAGINDIAGNTGPSTLDMIEDNLSSMVDLARANGIHVVLSSVLPAYAFPWNPGLQPAEKVVELNVWIKDYAKTHGCIYVDYFTPMADEKHAMKGEYSFDGVHPNLAGFKVMEPLIESSIQKALKK